jgi:hypothetical protein
MEARLAYRRRSGRDDRKKANYQGLTPIPSLPHLEPAGRGIGRGHPGTDVLDSLCSEDYGLADPTTLNVITASVPPFYGGPDGVLLWLLISPANRRRFPFGFPQPDPPPHLRAWPP